MSPEPFNKPLRVFVVDDSALSRVSLKTTIQQYSGQQASSQQASCLLQWVGEAQNGQEALLKLQQMCTISALKPHVVLMDIGMPVLDGIQATQQLKHVLPQLPVLMLTSHQSDDDVLSAFQSGARSYCLKDTPPQQLAQAIVHTAQGGTWLDPRIAGVLLRLTESLPVASVQQKAEQSTAAGGSILTDREQEVLRLIAQGLGNAEIADKLCLSLNTVKTHLKSIFNKLQVDDRTTAALKALREGLV